MLSPGFSWAGDQTGAQSFDFDVYLGKRAIGTHRFDVYRDAGGTARVESRAIFNVRILGVTVYRYRHQAAERWEEGCLRHMRSETDDNGDRVQVDASPDGCVFSYAYWDPALLTATTLLNPQTGKLDSVKFAHMGREEIVVQGETVTADHHRLTSRSYAMDLWYASDGRWLQLDSTTADGRTVHYRLKDPS
jgi:hypothetical protein